MNRISQAIAKMDERVKSKNLSPEKLEQVNRSLDITDISEYSTFQQLKSAAAGGVLTADEAQTIYGYLGNTPEQFNRQPLAVKAVLTQIFKELLDRQIKSK